MKTLALDYGLARVGAAVSYASLAQPLLILGNNQQLIPGVLQLIEQHRVELVLVGVSEGEMAQESARFARQLKQKTNVPVELVDETLSSHQVREYLRVLPAKKRRGRIDHYAAAVILQNYLDDQV